MTSTKAAKIMRRFWQRQSLKDPKSWSLRQIARELKISPGYLSKVFSGQKPMNKQFAKKLIICLKADDLIKKSILSCFEKSSEFKKNRSHAPLSNKNIHEEYELASESAEWLLKRWYHTSILDMMTMSTFKSDPAWISAQLGISKTEVDTALKLLVNENLATVDSEGRYSKKHLKIRFPTTISKSVIREYHKQQIKRATQIMEANLLPKDFNSRMIVGISIATNAEKLQKAKDLLHSAMYEAAEILMEGPCTEIYQLNIQLFPQMNLRLER